MSGAITAYPLSWPAGWPRMDPSDRNYGRFGRREKSATSSWSQLRDVTIADGTRRTLDELDRMKARDVIISTDLKLRRDGLPRSDQREPADPGAAVYWTDRNGADRCIAIDRYTKIAHNLAAIAATLEAMRAIERHGGAEILDRAFTGFTALEHMPGAPHWSEILGVARDAGIDTIAAAYRRKRSEHHPDNGGAAERFHEVSEAYKRACEEVQP